MATSAKNNRYMYTGREWDEDLGLYYFRARMYDPYSGRFCSRDPTGLPETGGGGASGPGNCRTVSRSPIEQYWGGHIRIPTTIPGISVSYQDFVSL